MSRPQVSFPAPVRITVVVDDEILRHGLVHIVSQVDGFDCLGSHCDDAGLANLHAPHPDVVLAGADSVGEVAAALNGVDPAPKVIAIVDPVRASADTVALIRAGVDAVIDPRSSSAQVQRVVRDVLTGRLALDAYSAHAVMAEIRTQAGDAVGTEAPMLTLRERDVLALLTEGLDNRTIAGRLCVSEATVKFHLRNVMEKYGIHRRAALVSAALRDQRTARV